VQVTEQQREASERVTRNIESIAELASTNDAAIQHTVRSAEALEELAGGLNDSVARFKV
jgi:methyl-accepting chemotaxis protein